MNVENLENFDKIEGQFTPRFTKSLFIVSIKILRVMSNSKKQNVISMIIIQIAQIFGSKIVKTTTAQIKIS